MNGTLYFEANDGVHGWELWKSDGTEAGTVMVKDISPGAGSAYHQLLTNVNGTLFFEANDGVHGWELWKSDGTDSRDCHGKGYPTRGATSMVCIILTAVNGTLSSEANDDVHGWELWKSDGTEAGTVMAMDIYPGSRQQLSWGLCAGGRHALLHGG